MDDTINSLKAEFDRIKNLGWIKEKRKSTGSCGYTFESLLRKEEDNFPLPDYNNIEIKVMNDNTKTNLHLFNLIPDGDYLFPIKRILDELGCPGKVNRSEKRFYRTFNAKEYTKMVFGRKGIIGVNYDEAKVELIVFDNKGENINIGISWSFDYIKERLELKMQYLAFIRVSSCIICGEGYYHYHDIFFYHLKSFETFIDLIAKGIIDITFKIGIHTSGNKIGKVYDHGTDFSITISDLEQLYDEIS